MIQNIITEEIEDEIKDRGADEVSRNGGKENQRKLKHARRSEIAGKQKHQFIGNGIRYADFLEENQKEDGGIAVSRR